MTRKVLGFGMLLLLFPLLGLATATAEEAAPAAKDGADKTFTRVYRYQYITAKQASGLVYQQCTGAMKAGYACGTTEVLENRSMIQVRADEATHAAIAAALKEVDLPPPTQSFQLLLVEASKGGTSDDAIPENARQALDALRGLLPYKSFRVIDIGWFRTSSSARISLGGPRGYESVLRFRGDPKSGGALFVEDFELVLAVSKYPVLTTSLTMNPGETVVVGTSKLVTDSKLDGGDKALVVLLTAVK